MTGILNFAPALAEVFTERQRQADKFGHTADADFDAYWNANNGRTHLASVAVRFSDSALDHMSVGALKTARKFAVKAAASNLALVELIDRVIDHTGAPAGEQGKAA